MSFLYISLPINAKKYNVSARKKLQKLKYSPWSYKTFFVLNLAEHEIFPVHKY